MGTGFTGFTGLGRPAARFSRLGGRKFTVIGKSSQSVAISMQEQAGVFLGWGRHPSKTLALGAFLTLFLLQIYSTGAPQSP